MNEHSDDNNFLLCLENSEHYKYEKGELIQYQRLSMMYNKRLNKEFKAYRLRKGKADADEDITDNTAETEKPGNNVAPNDNISNNDY